MQEFRQADERTKLLPPTGISSNEHSDRRYHNATERSSSRSRRYRQARRIAYDDDWMKSQTKSRSSKVGSQDSEDQRKRRSKNKKKHRRRMKREAPLGDSSGSSSVSTSSASSRSDHSRVYNQEIIMDKERQKLYRKWKAEVLAQDEAKRKENEENRWYRRLYRYVKSETSFFVGGLFGALIWTESFLANLPLIIGAIALAFANLGVDWYKFTEENLKSCKPVHFHSAQCTFPEVSNI